MEHFFSPNNFIKRLRPFIHRPLPVQSLNQRLQISFNQKTGASMKAAPLSLYTIFSEQDKTPHLRINCQGQPIKK
jgi:hypothetical protein